MRLEGIPIHHERRLKFRGPKELKKRFEQYPLDRDFVDWVRGVGYKISYGKVLFSCVSFEEKMIIITDFVKPEEYNAHLLHELVHISVPDHRLMFRYLGRCNLGNKIYGRYEEVIEEVAEKLLGLEGFVDYVKRTIPN